jgi:hypothetical protein
MFDLLSGFFLWFFHQQIYIFNLANTHVNFDIDLQSSLFCDDSRAINKNKLCLPLVSIENASNKSFRRVYAIPHTIYK